MTRIPAAVNDDPMIRSHRPLYRLPGEMPWRWGDREALEQARAALRGVLA